MSDKPPTRPAAPKTPLIAQRRQVMPGLAGGNRPPAGRPNPERALHLGVEPQSSGIRPSFWKRKYLVYPKFQMTLILLNSLVTVIMFTFVAFQVVRSHVYLENLVRSTRLPAQNLFTQMLSMQLRNLLVNLAIALFVSVGLTGIFTLLMSHRVAGPLIRLRNLFKSISRTGEFPEAISFRKGDFFEDLPPLINQAFLAIKKKWIR